MPDSLLTNSKIIAAYREKTKKSSELAEKARETFRAASPATHDTLIPTVYMSITRKVRGNGMSMATNMSIFSAAMAP